MNKLHLIFFSTICGLIIISCNSFLGKGNRLSFKEKQILGSPKIIQVFIRGESSSETSDYWNNYTIEVFNENTKSRDFTIEFSVDQRTDEYKILGYSSRYLWMFTTKLMVFDLTKKAETLTEDSIIKMIERLNPFLETKIATFSYSNGSMRVVTKQGDSFFINPESFIAYKSSNFNQDQLPDSLFLDNKTPYPITNVFGPNGKQIVQVNPKSIYSLEPDNINESFKSFIYSYNFDSAGLDQNNQIQISTDVKPHGLFTDEKRTIAYSKPFFTSLIIGVVSDNLYIKHYSEVGDGGKRLLSKYNCNTSKVDWSFELNQVGCLSTQTCLTEIWSNDLKCIFFVGFNSSDNDTIYKFDTEKGALLNKYY